MLLESRIEGIGKKFLHFERVMQRKKGVNVYKRGSRDCRRETNVS